jgi:hypothetical protein
MSRRPLLSHLNDVCTRALRITAHLHQVSASGCPIAQAADQGDLGGRLGACETGSAPGGMPPSRCAPAVRAPYSPANALPTQWHAPAGPREARRAKTRARKPESAKWRIVQCARGLRDGCALWGAEELLGSPQRSLARTQAFPPFPAATLGVMLFFRSGLGSWVMFCSRRTRDTWRGCTLAGLHVAGLHVRAARALQPQTHRPLPALPRWRAAHTLSHLGCRLPAPAGSASCQPPDARGCVSASDSTPSTPPPAHSCSRDLAGMRILDAVIGGVER